MKERGVPHVQRPSDLKRIMLSDSLPQALRITEAWTWLH
jgi:hypothetical protein